MLSVSFITNFYFASVYGGGEYGSSLYSADPSTTTNGSNAASGSTNTSNSSTGGGPASASASTNSGSTASGAVTPTPSSASVAEKQTNGATAGVVATQYKNETAKNNALGYEIIFTVFIFVVLLFLIFALWRTKRKKISVQPPNNSMGNY